MYSLLEPSGAEGIKTLVRAGSEILAVVNHMEREYTRGVCLRDPQSPEWDRMQVPGRQKQPVSSPKEAGRLERGREGLLLRKRNSDRDGRE